jgi:hypothetical protein
MNRRRFIYGSMAVAAAGIGAWPALGGRLSSAAPITTDSIGDQVQRLARGQYPAFAGTGETRTLYRYAVEHGDDLQYIPCTCGCVRFGHRSNHDCYIKSVHQDGTLTFTSHAAT